MAILDQYGRPIPEKKLAREPAELATINQVLRWQDSVATGLEPDRLARILRDNDSGFTLDMLGLAVEMEERDLHYYSQINTRKSAISGAPRRVEPGDESAAAQKAADEFQQYVVEMPEFAWLIDDLMDAVPRCYSVVQPIWDTTTTPWTFSEFKHHDPRCFMLDYPRFQYLQIRPYDNNIREGLPFPPGFWLQHFPRIRTGVKLRAGIARLAAINYLFKTSSITGWLSFAEVYGMPLRIGTYDPNTASEDERAALRRALVNLGHDAACMIPKGMDIRFEDARRPTSGDNLFQGLADYFDEQTSKAINGQTTGSDAKSSGIGSGDAQAHKETRLDIKRADALAVAATINKLARAWTNFTQGENVAPPKVYIDVDPPEDIATKATTLKTIADALVSLKTVGKAIPDLELQEEYGLELEDTEPLAPAPAPGDTQDKPKPAPAPNAALVAGPNMVRKRGKKWVVLSADGSKTLGTYKTRAQAVNRLGQIEYFKHAENAALPAKLEFAEESAGALLSNWEELLAPHRDALANAAATSTDYVDFEARLKKLAKDINSDPLVRAMAIEAMKARGIASA